MCKNSRLTITTLTPSECVMPLIGRIKVLKASDWSIRGWLHTLWDLTMAKTNDPRASVPRWKTITATTLLITDRWRPDFLSQVQYHWKHGELIKYEINNSTISFLLNIKRGYKTCKNWTTLQPHKHKPFYDNIHDVIFSNRVSLQFLFYLWPRYNSFYWRIGN